MTAVIVVLPPSETLFPLIVIELLIKAELGMLVSVLVEPLIDVPARVVSVPPKETEVDPIVTELLASPEFGIAELICPAEMLINVLDALVTCPCALTTKVGTELATP